MKTVNLTLCLKNANKIKAVGFIKKLQDLNDIPLQYLDIRYLNKNEIEVEIGYGLKVFDRTVSQFMAVLFGEFPLMRNFGEVKFKDLHLPVDVWQWFGGPQFGAEVILKKSGAMNYPVLMAIIKPSIGEFLTIENIKDSVDLSVEGGFHFVKDDEMQGDFDYAPLASRLKLATEINGYVPTVNLDSESDYERAVDNKKINMILVNASVIGFPLLNTIAKKTKVPILSHLSLQGTYYPSFSPKLYALLHRLFGCDAFITPMGDKDYYRVSRKEELEMSEVLTCDFPAKKTLPFLTGGGNLRNISQTAQPYEQADMPYGMVFGTLIYNSDESPKKMASLVSEQVRMMKDGGLV